MDNSVYTLSVNVYILKLHESDTLSCDSYHATFILCNKNMFSLSVLVRLANRLEIRLDMNFQPYRPFIQLDITAFCLLLYTEAFAKHNNAIC